MRKQSSERYVFALLLFFPLVLVAKQAPWVGKTFGDLVCSGQPTRFGPFDYIVPADRANLRIVETYHFTAKVERLIHGESGTIAGDLDYTLRAFPNHHRALRAVSRYQLALMRGKSSKKLLSSVECYFQRALRFSPQDGVTQLLFAMYLHQLGYKQKALQRYEKAEKILPNNSELHYNFGLLLVDLKQYKQANHQANIAYQLGYPFAGLRNRLKKLGYWKNN